MHRTARAVATGLSVAALGMSPVPAYGAHDTPAKVTGGGWLAVFIDPSDPSSDRVHLSVNLPCPDDDGGFDPQPDPPGRLQVRWGEHAFHLEEVEHASCNGNVYEGSGTGRCGSEQGIIIDMRLVDESRGGHGRDDARPDSVELEIGDTAARCALSVGGPLGGGNIHMSMPMPMPM